MDNESNRRNSPENSKPVRRPSGNTSQRKKKHRLSESELLARGLKAPYGENGNFIDFYNNETINDKQ